jgi:hypothetical protein
MIGAGLAGCSFELVRNPTLDHGWMVMSGDATTLQGTCGALPILLTGSHTDTRLAGPCRQVTVTGDHNDVTLGLEPGAKVEVTGDHNDIWWHQRRPGLRPDLVDRGAANVFHAAPWPFGTSGVALRR